MQPTILVVPIQHTKKVTKLFVNPRFEIYIPLLMVI
jgi:hypothetical protein